MSGFAILIGIKQDVVIWTEHGGIDGFQREFAFAMHFLGGHAVDDRPTELHSKFSDSSRPVSDTCDDHQFVAFDDGSRILPQVEENAISCGSCLFAWYQGAAEVSEKVISRDESLDFRAEIGRPEFLLEIDEKSDEFCSDGFDLALLGSSRHIQ